MSNLIQQTVEQVVEITSGEGFDVQGSTYIDSESVTKRVRKYEAACATLMAMATIGGRWAEEEHHQVWQQSLQRLGSIDVTEGIVFWIDLKKYPGNTSALCTGTWRG